MVHAYSFYATLDKKELMLGEEVNLTLIFTYDNIARAEIEEYEIEELHLDNIKTTLISDEEYHENNKTWVEKQIYTLIPKSSGKLIIPPINLYIESIPLSYQKVYNRNKYLEKIDVKSKALELDVRPLPEGISISGEYKLVAMVDKKEVDSGQPIRFSLTLEGRGNLESLEFFKLKIPHTTIYSESSKELTKNFTIVSDRNYTIPPVTLKYYNALSRSIEFIDTPNFAIEVRSDVPIKTENYAWFWYGLLIVLFLLLCCYWFYITPRNPLIKSLKQSNSKEELLRRVVPYMEKSKNLKRLIFKLETSDKQTFKSLKKEIIKEIHLYTKEKK
jgi:hypothetical protein